MAVVVAVFVFTFYPVARVQYRETRDKARLESEFAVLEARNQRLTRQVERLRTPEGVEDYARANLGLVRQGERVVVVTGLPGSEVESRSASPVIDSDYVAQGPSGPWGEFLDFVFDVQ